MPTKKSTAKKKREIIKEEQEQKPKKSLDKQLFWIIGWMIFLIIIFLFAFSVFKENQKVDYQGMIFTKAKFGEIPVYHYYYLFKDSQGQLIKYNLYVRTDPRKNNVPVNGEINLIGDRPLFLGINNTGVIECSKSAVAVSDLLSFLLDNQLKVKAGTTDLNESIAKSETYVSCEKYPQNSVIILEKGDSTSINANGNCYTITVSDCEIMDAVEKFKIQAVADARAKKNTV